MENKTLRYCPICEMKTKGIINNQFCKECKSPYESHTTMAFKAKDIFDTLDVTNLGGELITRFIMN